MILVSKATISSDVIGDGISCFWFYLKACVLFFLYKTQVGEFVRMLEWNVWYFRPSEGSVKKLNIVRNHCLITCMLIFLLLISLSFFLPKFVIYEFGKSAGVPLTEEFIPFLFKLRYFIRRNFFAVPVPFSSSIMCFTV